MRPVIAALIAAMGLAACGHTAPGGSPGVPGSGSGPARGYAVADFTGVNLLGPDDVEVTTGTGFSVRAEGDPAELDKLRITKEGQTLSVDRGSGFHIGLSRGVKVFVTMPRIGDARVTGSGNLRVDQVAGDKFAGEAAGSGDLIVRALNANAVTVMIGGSGDVTLAGKARSVDFSVTGSGAIDARHLEAASAKVDVSGSGRVRAEVKGAANVTSTGSGDVDLGGGAHCTIEKSGTGSVRCDG